MNYLGTVFTGGMFNTGDSTQDEIENMENLADKHCKDLMNLIE